MKKFLFFAATALVMLVATSCENPYAPKVLTPSVWTYTNSNETATITISTVNLSGISGVVNYSRTGILSLNYSSNVKFTYDPWDGEGDFYPESGSEGVFGEFEFKNDGVMEVDASYKMEGGQTIPLLNDVWFNKSQD